MLDQNTRLKVDNALEGVLIRAETQRACKQNKSNSEKLRQFIRQQLRNAEQEASEMKKLAYQKGFEAGFTHIFSFIEPYFFEKSQLLERLSQEVNQRLEKILGDIWENETVLLTILQNTLKEDAFSMGDKHNFIVYLPSAQRHNHPFIEKLKGLLHSEDAEWIFHDEDRYIIKNNDQIIEFNPEENTETLKKYFYKQVDIHDRIQDFQKRICNEFIQRFTLQMREMKKGIDDNDGIQIESNTKGCNRLRTTGNKKFG